MADALPGGLTVRGGEITVSCQRCGLTRSVRGGLHTLAEFWEVMRARSWQISTESSGRGVAVLCPDCAASNDRSRRTRVADRGWGDADA